jgi:hypothetical protein
MPEPTGDQGAAQFRADLAAYLDSLFLHELADLLGELPEPTRVALMHELSERGPAWAKLPEDWPQLPRRSLRESSWPTAAPAASGPPPSSCAAGRPRPTGRPTSSPTSAAPLLWPSGAWLRRCGPGRPAVTPPKSVSSGRSRRRAGRRGRATGRAKTATIADPMATTQGLGRVPGLLPGRIGSPASRAG